jgi:hypothetical protein
MNLKLHKIIVITKLSASVNCVRNGLLDELINFASDDNIFSRRMLMLHQLSEFESQAIKKILNFQTDNADDLIDGYNHLISELKMVASKNG